MIRLKSKEDIEGIAFSCKMVAELFQYIGSTIAIGMTGIELDRLAREWIAKRGGVPAFLGYEGFPAALCISVNQAVIHGIPTKRPFAEGDIVGVDCGINVRGYFSDMAYTYPMGKISPQLQKLLKTTEESLYLGIEQAKAGGRINDISRAIFQHCKAQGYGVVRPYCGHGVGFSVHEDPQVPNFVGGGANPRLKPGMVLAIEPMINAGGDDVRVLDDDWTVVTRDGLPSAHFEHTIAILEDRTVILTTL